MTLEDVAETQHAALAANALQLDRLVNYDARTPCTGRPAAIQA
jgi:hypothetical protein